MNDLSETGLGGATDSPESEEPHPGDQFPDSGKRFDDNREPGEWQTRYPPEARRCITNEAWVLACTLVISLIVGGLLLSVVDESLKYTIQFSSTNAISVNVQIRILAIFAVGCVGGTTFSIKWLVHAVAKRKWHLDRRYWRFFVPAIGGVYACVVLTLAEGGLVGAQTAGQTRSAALTAALAFLVGYFSDGVSGLLSNVANAVFGTLEKK